MTVGMNSQSITITTWVIEEQRILQAMSMFLILIQWGSSYAFMKHISNFNI